LLLFLLSRIDYPCSLDFGVTLLLYESCLANVRVLLIVLLPSQHDIESVMGYVESHIVVQEIVLETCDV
jgi:hypothetical protein